MLEEGQRLQSAWKSDLRTIWRARRPANRCRQRGPNPLQAGAIIKAHDVFANPEVSLDTLVRLTGASDHCLDVAS